MDDTRNNFTQAQKLAVERHKDTIVEEINCMVEDAWTMYIISLGDSETYGIYEGLLDALIKIDA